MAALGQEYVSKCPRVTGDCSETSPQRLRRLRSQANAGYARANLNFPNRRMRTRTSVVWQGSNGRSVTPYADSCGSRPRYATAVLPVVAVPPSGGWHAWIHDCQAAAQDISALGRREAVERPRREIQARIGQTIRRAVNVRLDE